jgi:release factor glutamine methyltransferase
LSETLGPRASRHPPPYPPPQAGEGREGDAGGTGPPKSQSDLGTPTSAVPAAALCVDAARRGIARRFRDRGIDTPDLDARILVGHALGLDHTALMLSGERRLGADEIAHIEALAARRIGREPIARITGAKEFWGLPFKITPAVLVPRPETETIVTEALATLDLTGARSHALRIADLGVGSGAILIALLVELPNASAIGTDRDLAALALARENARRLGVATRAAFVACDFGAAVAPGCDLVVTNPPYIRTDEIAKLEPEVREFDPLGAIDGGLDGLAAYRVIAVHARYILAPGAHLIAEIGKGQGDAVAALFAAAGFGKITMVPDLAGIARAVVALRNP